MNILVIGGSSGIGEKLIEELKKDNNNYIINASRRENDDVKNIFLDINDNNSIYNLSNNLFSNQKIDHLYICSGISENPSDSLKTDFNEIDKIVNVNCIGVIKVISVLQNNMHFNGSIVVLSSANSTRGGAENPIYSGSKGMLDSFVRAYSKTLLNNKKSIEYSININTVNPEMIYTPMIENIFGVDIIEVENSRILGRFLKYDEIVPLMIFLSSKFASGITGSNFKIGGEA